MLNLAALKQKHYGRRELQKLQFHECNLTSSDRIGTDKITKAGFGRTPRNVPQLVSQQSRFSGTNNWISISNKV
jgi:hypothetical protein